MKTFYKEIVEDFGIGYLKFGHSELMGRVIGFLLSCTSASSVDDICRELKVTKTPVNQICRRLEDLKLIRRVRKSGERKYYYEISNDVFLQAGINQSRLYEDNIQVAERHLQALLAKYIEADGPDKAALKAICERLIRMREFHFRQVQAYQRFISEWRTNKNALPSVDEYAASVGLNAA